MYRNSSFEMTQNIYIYIYSMCLNSKFLFLFFLLFLSVKREGVAFSLYRVYLCRVRKWLIQGLKMKPDQIMIHELHDDLKLGGYKFEEELIYSVF